MVVDSSAIVALILGEPGAGALADRLDGAAHRLTHPLAIFEAAAAIARAKERSLLEAYRDIAEFLASAAIEIVPLDQPEAIAAIEAFSRFGRGHPASLNMGDCFSYACAQVRGVPLLAAGEDFAQTDLA